MEPEDLRQTLLDLRAELENLPTDASSSSQAVSWRLRTRSALTRALGADHYITTGFIGIHWTTIHDKDAETFHKEVPRAHGYLDAAVDEVRVATANAGALEATGVDPELWEHVASNIAAEAWATVASQTAIFTEDRVRWWTGQPAELSERSL